jgi:hypothetical protein
LSCRRIPLRGKNKNEEHENRNPLKNPPEYAATPRMVKEKNKETRGKSHYLEHETNIETEGAAGF